MSKIIGYRDLTPFEVELINAIKEMAERAGKVVVELEQGTELDQRWLAIGRTHLQQGFMALTRAVARPTTF